MSCPYLTELTMAYCRAFPVRKPVPSDRLTTASRCEGEGFGTCPVFAEMSTRLGNVVRELAAEAAEAAESHQAPKGRGS